MVCQEHSSPVAGSSTFTTMACSAAASTNAFPLSSDERDLVSSAVPVQAHDFHCSRRVREFSTHTPATHVSSQPPFLYPIAPRPPPSVPALRCSTASLPVAEPPPNFECNSSPSVGPYTNHPPASSATSDPPSSAPLLFSFLPSSRRPHIIPSSRRTPGHPSPLPGPLPASYCSPSPTPPQRFSAHSPTACPPPSS